MGIYRIELSDPQEGNAYGNVNPVSIFLVDPLCDHSFSIVLPELINLFLRNILLHKQILIDISALIRDRCYRSKVI